MTAEALRSKKREIERKVRAREFVFGIQNGLLSGVSAATQDPWTVAITGVAAGLTGGLSMATGSYLSSKPEKEILETELLDQERLASEQPYLAKEALLEALVADGLDRPAACTVVETMSQRQELLLRTVQEKVLGLGSADISKPVQAGVVMFASFLLGAAIPLIPYLAAPLEAALWLSWGASVLTLFGVGMLRGIVTHRSSACSGRPLWAGSSASPSNPSVPP
jgi:VIT1/CCC1 family predicted Fe2+/Mn2+ transporter